MSERIAIVRLSELEQEALDHLLSEPYGFEVRIGIFDKLRAALASPQPQVEEEYRVVGQGREREERTPAFGSLSHAKDRAWQLANPDTRLVRPLANIRIQHRTVTTLQDGTTVTSPWVDLSETGGDS